MGMSVLGLMALHRRNDHQTSNTGMEYSFCDFAVGGHSAQDSVQVSALLQTIVSFVKDKFPLVSKIIVQSDNASCFASQNLIPYVFHMNASNQEKGLPLIIRWIYTEAQTGRGRLDTHFSYMNLKIKSFLEDGNDVLVEKDIIRALSFQGGVAGTTA
eukprot:15336682-Ditylum_brightwellii.AAC.1